MNDHQASCAVERCQRPIAVMWAGLCKAHYTRLWTNGDVNSAEPIRSRSARSWKLALTYHGAVARLRRTRGPASAHPCARCQEERATQWRLIDPANPPQVTGHPKRPNGPPAGLPFSSNPADYEPLCRGCLQRSANPEQPSLFDQDDDPSDRGPP